jgi:hypothetical protein
MSEYVFPVLTSKTIQESFRKPAEADTASVKAKSVETTINPELNLNQDFNPPELWSSAPYAGMLNLPESLPPELASPLDQLNYALLKSSLERHPNLEDDEEPTTDESQLVLKQLELLRKNQAHPTALPEIPSPTKSHPTSHPSIQETLRAAYVSNHQELQKYTARLMFVTQMKQILRDELCRVRAFQSQHQKVNSDGQPILDAEYETKEFSLQPEYDADGITMHLREPRPQGKTQSATELESYAHQIEQQLATCGDDAQLAQLDLQMLAQRQQQTLQALSSISKAIHETSMSIIRKIGG